MEIKKTNEKENIHKKPTRSISKRFKILCILILVIVICGAVLIIRHNRQKASLKKVFGSITVISDLEAKDNFEIFEGPQIGAVVKTLINKVILYNENYEKEQATEKTIKVSASAKVMNGTAQKLTSDISEIENIYSEISIKKQYRVIISYNKDNSVKTIEIKTIEE